MLIKNDSDFRIGYEMLNILTNSQCNAANPEKLADHIKSLKQSLRLYAHRDVDYNRRIVRDYGMDGYLAVMRLPDDLRSLEEVNNFFADFVELHCTPSPYDCTRQAFTNWFRVFWRNGGYCAYHSVSFDV